MCDELRCQLFTKACFGNMRRAANAASGVAPSETQVAQAKRELAFYMDPFALH